MDPAIALALRASLVLLFGAAALHKLRDLRRFRAIVAEYRIVPAALAPVAGVAIVAGEVAVAGTLALPSTRAGWAGAAALAGIYAVALAVNLRRGRRRLDCGCLGAGGRGTISWWLVGRNLVLVAIALAGVVPPGERALGWVDAITATGLAGVAALAWIAVDGLVANLPAVERARA